MTEEWIFRVCLSGFAAAMVLCLITTALLAAVLEGRNFEKNHPAGRELEFLSLLQLTVLAVLGLTAYELGGLLMEDGWMVMAAMFLLVVLLVLSGGVHGAGFSENWQAFLKKLPVLEGPGCRAGRRMTTDLVEALTPHGVSTRDGMDEEEIHTWVEMEVEAGTLAPYEGEILLEAFKLKDKTAGDCMTPRVDVASIPNTSTRDEVIEVATSLRHRRMPVYHETPDEIVGVLDVQDWLIAGSGRSMIQSMKSPWLVPETKPAVDLLEAFLQDENGMAVVVDEFGGFEGVVTYSDIVETLVSDALPSGEYAVYLQPLGQGRVLASGRARLDDLGEILGHEIEADGIDTIGGLVFTMCGHMPKANQRVVIENLDVMVRRISGRRIEEVLVTWIGPEPGGEELP